MSDFVYREPGKIVADVIQHEMELTAAQVLFSNQKFNIPTEGIFVVVSYIGPSKIIANSMELEDQGAAGAKEVSSIVMSHMVQIDILGYGNDVRTRKEEIAMALLSFYSQGRQEIYQMQIARQCSPFLDTSFLEETKMITRYTTTVRTTSVNQKTKTADYYSSFPTEVYSNTQEPAFAQFNAKDEPAVLTAGGES